MHPFSPSPGGTITAAAGVTAAASMLGAMPRTGPFQVRIENPGSTEVCFKFGDSTVQAALTDHAIPGGAIEVLTVQNPQARPVTHVSVITASGSASPKFTVGIGL